MKPTIPNAFRPSNENNLNRAGGEGGAAIASMQATLETHDDERVLHLAPIRPVEALRWSPDTPEQDTPVKVLISGVQLQVAGAFESTETAAAIADRFAVPIQARFDDDKGLVLDLDDAVTLVSVLETHRVRLTKIAGPIERRDDQAIMRAWAQQRSPLEVELRATAAMQVDDDRRLTLHVRETDQALRVVAQSFRQYLAAVLGDSAQKLATPDLDVLRHLFSISGSITVRPIETEVFPGSVDVGVSPMIDTERPADIALIYDRPSRSWHGDF